MTRHPPPRQSRVMRRGVPVPGCRLGRGLFCPVCSNWIGALAAGLACCLHAAEFGSEHYVWREPAVAGGGGVAASLSYRLVSSVGLPGGLSQSADGQISSRQGSVGSLNDPPVPRADTLRSSGDATAKVRVASLLANDADPEGDRLELLQFDALTTAGGRVSLDNGWLLYESPTPFPGVDTFRYTIADAAGNPATALVTLLFSDAGFTPSQNLIAITILPNGHRYVVFAGIAGRTYTIQWSDQLPATQWQVLAAVPADSRGLVEWVDATHPVPPERYYRTLSP